MNVKKLLKCNSGSSQLVAVIVIIPVVIMLVIIGITAIAYSNKYEQLDNFADELIAQAGAIGKCQGMSVDKRYDELANATGLSPEYEFDASYFDVLQKTVQYGDTITLKVTLETELIGFYGFSIPATLKRTKTTQSEQYWK